MNITEQTAINLKTARKAAKITQADLAKELGITQQALSCWENQTRRIPLEVAIRASMILKTQIIPIPEP